MAEALRSSAPAGPAAAIAISGQCGSQSGPLGRHEQVHPVHALRPGMRGNPGAVRVGSRRARTSRADTGGRRQRAAGSPLRILRDLRRLLSDRRPGRPDVGRIGKTGQGGRDDLQLLRRWVPAGFECPHTGGSSGSQRDRNSRSTDCSSASKAATATILCITPIG